MTDNKDWRKCETMGIFIHWEDQLSLSCKLTIILLHNPSITVLGIVKILKLTSIPEA